VKDFPLWKFSNKVKAIDGFVLHITLVGSNCSLSLLFMMKVIIWWVLWGYDLGLCCITFKVLLWRFLCNLIGMLPVVFKRGFTLHVRRP
jgi:hypothetical protein